MEIKLITPETKVPVEMKLRDCIRSPGLYQILPVGITHNCFPKFVAALSQTCIVLFYENQRSTVLDPQKDNSYQNETVIKVAGRMELDFSA
jgi:hypothetical protein